MPIGTTVPVTDSLSSGAWQGLQGLGEGGWWWRKYSWAQAIPTDLVGALGAVRERSKGPARAQSHLPNPLTTGDPGRRPKVHVPQGDSRP